MLEPEIRKFTASDGYRFHYRRWRTGDAPPRGYVVALHGIQSHSGWYEFSSNRMAQAGYEVCFLDRRGSGLNQEFRGHSPHPDRLVNDVVQFLTELQDRRNREAPDGPVILLSVSWGCKLAAVTAVRRSETIDALALLYPGICAKIQPRWDQKLRLDFASWLGISRRTVPIPLGDAALFTGEPKWQEFIKNDSLALHRMTVSLIQCSLELDRMSAQSPARIRCPLLLMLAGKDRIIDNAGTRRWFERVASTRRQLIEYPEAQHTLEFEPNRDRFADDLIGWLDSVREDC